MRQIEHELDTKKLTILFNLVLLSGIHIQLDFWINLCNPAVIFTISLIFIQCDNNYDS